METLDQQKLAKRTGYAPVNGINIYYELYGKGEIPLVLIHGGGSTIQSSFGEFLPLIADYGKIIGVELQAHGRTNDRNAPESFEQDADDVVGLLEYLNIPKANFLGFSNGGTTTMQIAIRHPQIVNKIIIVSAAFKREGFISGFFENMPHATIDNMPQPLKDAYLDVASNENGLHTMFRKDKERMINFKDIPDQLVQSISAPALIITGDQDVTTVDHAVLISQMVKGSKLLVVPGTHGSFIGEVCSIVKGSKIPEATATVILEFLHS